MPVKIITKVRGLKDLEASLGELGKTYGDPKYAYQALRPAVKAAIQPLVDIIKASTPVDTGRLAASTDFKVKKPSKKELNNPNIGSDAVVLGLAGWYWRASEGSLWRQALSVEFGNSKTTARPTLRPALESQVNSMISTFTKELRKSIDKKSLMLSKKYNKRR